MTQINSLNSYCVGGGFVDDCAQEAVATILIPPKPGEYYADPTPRDVVATIWERHGNILTIQADLGNRVDASGVYTAMLWDEATDADGFYTTVLIELSVFKD